MPDQSPTASVNGSYEEKYEAGAVVKVLGYTVTDDKSVNVVSHVYLRDKNGIKEVKVDDEIVLEKGQYQIIYRFEDESKNATRIAFDFEVKDNG